MLEAMTRGERAAEATAAASAMALVSRGPADLAKFRDTPDVQRLIGDVEPYIFLENDGRASFPTGPGEAGSIYFAQCAGLFDAIMLDPAVRLLVSPWAKAFLAQLYRMVKPGGVLIVPAWLESEKKTFGRWRLDDFRTLFDAPVEAAGGGFARITRGRSTPAAPPSAARWFADNAHEVLLQHVIENLKYMHLGESSEVFAAATPEAARSHGSAYLAEQRQAFTKAQAYYVGGIAYKEPVIRHIIEDQLGRAGSIRIVDVGGGYGLLAAELALDPALDVAHATCVDISPLNERLAARYYADMADELHGRFSFVRAAAQDYAFEGQFDTILGVGSLLYVPRERLKETMHRAWAALKPGGVLIVHENIKSPRYERDYQYMFTVEEIDALLSGYGEIVRYTSNLCQRLTLEQAGEKTVFRAVRKAE
jgi:SAM-dependent methyltransferase